MNKCDQPSPNLAWLRQDTSRDYDLLPAGWMFFLQIKMLPWSVLISTKVYLFLFIPTYSPSAFSSYSSRRKNLKVVAIEKPRKLESITVIYRWKQSSERTSQRSPRPTSPPFRVRVSESSFSSSSTIEQREHLT
jgi:hypothetical protein